MVSTRKVHEADRPPFEAWLDSLNLTAETKEKLTAVSDIPERLLVGQEMVEILYEEKKFLSVMLLQFSIGHKSKYDRT